MEYPRTVIIENPKLEKLLKEKNDTVLEGRKLSEEIEVVEEEMHQINLEVEELEKKVDISEFKEEAEAVTDEYNAVLAKMEALNKKTADKMIAAVDPSFKQKYEEKKKHKEELENKRNKVALKVGKIKDKIIPLAQKAMSSYLENEYEDYDSIRFENNQIVATIFNHLEDWKKVFFSKKKK